MNREYKDKWYSYRIINLISDVFYDVYDTWWDAVDAYLDLNQRNQYAILIADEPGYYKITHKGDIVNVVTGEVGNTDKEVFLHIAEKTYDAAHNN